MATNAARYRIAAGKHVRLLEFGLRRAQGPDGGLSASKYSYVGKTIIFTSLTRFNSTLDSHRLIIYNPAKNGNNCTELSH